MYGPRTIYAEVEGRMRLLVTAAVVEEVIGAAVEVLGDALVEVVGGGAEEMVLIGAPGLVVQTWKISLSVHFQICTWLALAVLPLVRSRQKP